MRRLKQKRTYEVALTKAGLGPVAGVDEAGRGACCGPVTIAACILPERILPGLERLDDSKKLSPAARAQLEPIIKRRALSWSVVHIEARDIDTFGIQHANVSGMRRAVAQLEVRPGYVLTDALRVPGIPSPQLPIIGGDTAARCIAAASILAKVSRDRLMEDLEERYPGFGLGNHKGYGTAAHQEAIAQMGATPEHRMSYRNVAGAHADFLARA